MKKRKIIKISIISLLLLSTILIGFNGNVIVNALNGVIQKIIKPITTSSNINDSFIENDLINDNDFEEIQEMNRGNGSQEDPFMIYTSDDLINLSKLIFEDEKSVKDIYFKQANDISLKGIEFEPIGTLGYPFEGIYDGNGFTINDLSINTTNSFQGIFGFVTGTVKNLTVKGDIKVTKRADRSYSYSYVGGIVGAINNGASIENCINYVNVKGDIYTGGVVGVILANDNMKAKGAINTIKNCINYGNIITPNDYNNYVGGIVSYSAGDSQIENCINYGDITGNYCSGGIIGANYIAPITNCINVGNIVENKQFAGGIAGYSSGLIDACVNSGKITGLNDTGGIVGKSISTIMNCINEGQVTGLMRVGGVAGYIESSEFINNGSIDIKKYTAIDSFDNISINLATSKATIINCNNIGEIISTNSDSRIGGIVGAFTSFGNSTSSPGPIMIGCYNNGKVSGLSNVGGIVGWAYDKCLNNNASYSFQLGNEVYVNGDALSTNNLNGTGSSGYWIGRFSKNAAIVKSGDSACGHFE